MKRTVVVWTIGAVGSGPAVRMERSCGCEVTWNNEARVEDEWLIYPCLEHSGTKPAEESARHAIVEESRCIVL